MTLASLSPAFAAKGRPDRKPHRSGVRGGLIVLQFAVSIFLLTGMFIVFAQMHFIRTKDIGYDKENVIVLPLRDGTARKSGDGIKAEILRFPNILAALVPCVIGHLWSRKQHHSHGGYVAENGDLCRIASSTGLRGVDASHLGCYNIVIT